MDKSDFMGSFRETGKKSSALAYKDIRMFFGEWVVNPLRVASVIPSSQSLAGLITSEVQAGPLKVVEFGPGTGVFTRALIERGVPEEQLVLVENGPKFTSLLRERYPRATIMEIDAADFWKKYEGEQREFGAMISGLPLLSMPMRKVAGVLRSISRNMVAGGGFYQFTYGMSVPVSRKVLNRMGMRCRRVGGTLQNFPPASVYRIGVGKWGSGLLETKD